MPKRGITATEKVREVGETEGRRRRSTTRIEEGELSVMVGITTIEKGEEGAVGDVLLSFPVFQSCIFLFYSFVHLRLSVSQLCFILILRYPPSGSFSFHFYLLPALSCPLSSFIMTFSYGMILSIAL